MSDDEKQLESIENLSDAELRAALDGGQLHDYAAARRDVAANKQLDSTAGMTPAEITDAVHKGRLDDYLASKPTPRT
jgi:hypothetical protein